MLAVDLGPDHAGLFYQPFLCTSTKKERGTHCCSHILLVPLLPLNSIIMQICLINFFYHLKKGGVYKTTNPLGCQRVEGTKRTKLIHFHFSLNSF